MKIPLTSFIQFPAHEKSLSQIHESIWTHERGDSSILPRPQRISRYTPRPRTSDPPDWEREPWEPSAGWLNKNRKKHGQLGQWNSRSGQTWCSLGASMKIATNHAMIGRWAHESPMEVSPKKHPQHIPSHHSSIGSAYPDHPPEKIKQNIFPVDFP